MSRSAKIIISGIVIVSIALVYVFLPRNKALAPSTDQSASTSAKVSQTFQNTTVSKPEAKQSLFDQCVAQLKASANYSKAAQGLVIVSFTKVTSFDRAVSILESQSLSVSNPAQAQDDFTSNGFLEVSVPKGEEAKWVCTLRNISGVRNAILDTLINLHE